MNTLKEFNDILIKQSYPYFNDNNGNYQVNINDNVYKLSIPKYRLLKNISISKDSLDKITNQFEKHNTIIKELSLAINKIKYDLEIKTKWVGELKVSSVDTTNFIVYNIYGSIVGIDKIIHSKNFNDKFFGALDEFKE